MSFFGKNVGHNCCFAVKSWPTLKKKSSKKLLSEEQCNGKESGSLVTKCVLCKSSGKCNQYPAVALKMQLTSLITIHQ